MSLFLEECSVLGVWFLPKQPCIGWSWVLVKVPFLTGFTIQKLEIVPKHHNVVQITDESYLYNGVAVMHTV